MDEKQVAAKKPAKKYTVRSAPITWTGMGMPNSAMQHYVSVDGDEKYIFDFEDHGVRNAQEAIALAREYEAQDEKAGGNSQT